MGKKNSNIRPAIGSKSGLRLELNRELNPFEWKVLQIIYNNQGISSKKIQSMCPFPRAMLITPAAIQNLKRKQYIIAFFDDKTKLRDEDGAISPSNSPDKLYVTEKSVMKK